MADTNDIHRWLQGSAWRWVSPGIRPMVERLVAEGRAEWVNRWNRARAIPPGRPRTSIAARLRAENKRLREALDGLLENILLHQQGACPGITDGDCLDSIYESAHIAKAALSDEHRCRLPPEEVTRGATHILPTKPMTEPSEGTEP